MHYYNSQVTSITTETDNRYKTPTMKEQSPSDRDAYFNC